MKRLHSKRTRKRFADFGHNDVVLVTTCRGPAVLVWKICRSVGPVLTRIFPSVLSDGAHTASSACLTVSSLSESGRQVNLCGLEMFEKVVYKEGRKSKSIRMEKTAIYQLVFFSSSIYMYCQRLYGNGCMHSDSISKAQARNITLKSTEVKRTEAQLKPV